MCGQMSSDYLSAAEGRLWELVEQYTGGLAIIEELKLPDWMLHRR
jgi:hypothetical protein